MVGRFPAVQLALDFVAAVADAVGADRLGADVAEAADVLGAHASLDMGHALAMRTSGGIKFLLVAVHIGDNGVALRFSPHAR